MDLISIERQDVYDGIRQPCTPCLLDYVRKIIL